MMLRYNHEFIEDLKTECMSHSDIGRKFGVTRERVRQLALQLLSQTGREKQRVCTIRRAKPRTGKFSDEFLKVWNRARQHGLPVEKIVSIYWHGAALYNQLLINGHHCTIHYAKKYSSYFRISNRPKTLTPDGFIILVIPFDEKQNIFIIPNRVTLDTSCIYIPATKRYSSYRNADKRVNVNWFDYLEHWELLREIKFR